MTRRRDTARRHPRGFTLSEMLVVIVIFAVGILVFARLWPRGFVALIVTRDYATAQALAQGELDFLEARAQDLPEMIVAARYRFVQDAGGNWVLVLEADKDTPPTELGPGGDLLSNGNILIVNPGGNNAEIFWRLYNGPNRIRRVLGEGGAIPSPKPVGSEFGGLRVLAFAPVMSDPNLQSLFLVYGADMVGRGLVGTVAGQSIRNPRPWEFAYDTEMEQLWLPGDPNRDVEYKVDFSYWTNDAQGYRKVDLIDVVLKVVRNASTPPFEATYFVSQNRVGPFDLRAIANDPNWVALDADSLRVSRLYTQIPNAQPFSLSYPYEYKLLSAQLGLILFNPIAFTFRERRGRERVPLVAFVDYDVYNWHIIRDEFRADLVKSPLHKLRLGNLKSTGSMLNDRRRYPGLQLNVPGMVSPSDDFVLLDIATGGVVSPMVDPGNPNLGRSYLVDYLRGTIALGSPLSPPPAGPRDLGQSLSIIKPDGTLLTGIDPRGRTFRALYEAHNDWAIQVLKNPARYSVVRSQADLSIRTCLVPYLGSGQDPGPRIYFPWSDLGGKVSIREIWYRDGSGQVKAMRDQDFLIRAPRPTDPIQLPQIDIREVDANAVTLDYSLTGYAVRGVSGSSVRARVLWNTAQKMDVPGDTPQAIAERRELHEVWTRSWRFITLETYLSRRDSR